MTFQMRSEFWETQNRPRVSFPGTALETDTPSGNGRQKSFFKNRSRWYKFIFVRFCWIDPKNFFEGRGDRLRYPPINAPLCVQRPTRYKNRKYSLYAL